MKILAIESSAGAASAAFMDEGRLLAYAYQNNGLTHSATLMAMVQDMLKNSGLRLKDADAVAAAVGPGSFTGLRIGVAAAKGLAWGADIPCIGVSTLEAMARGVPYVPTPNASPDEETILCPVMDARCSQVYNALFVQKGATAARLCPDRALGLAALAQEAKNIGKPLFLVGDGAQLCYNFFGEKSITSILPPPHLRYQTAVGVCLAAFALREGAVPPEKLNPVYLRLPQAERERLGRLEKQKTSKEVPT